MTPDDKAIDALDAIFDDAALEEMEHGEITERDREWADALRARTRGQLAQLRRNFMPPITESPPPRPIRPAFQAMDRTALLAASNAIIQRNGGAIQVAYRHLTELSDDDLRRLLETLVEPE